MNKWLGLYLLSYVITEILGVIVKKSNIEQDKKMKLIAVIFYTGGAIGTCCLLL